MKLIIDVSEEDYRRIKLKMRDSEQECRMADAVYEGKPVTQAEWCNRSYASCGTILRWKADVVEYQCSKCKRWSQWWFGTCKNEYCSHCGAKMTNDFNTIDDYKRGNDK